MKMNSMSSTVSTNRNQLTQWLVWGIVFYLCLMALSIFYLASTGDTTTLGDPYYEDNITAAERAFAPWAFTLLIGVLALLSGILSIQFRKHKS